LDSSDELLAIAQANVNGTFIQRDLAEDGCLDGLGNFDVVCCLATLQHIPGVDNRGRLVRDLSEHLNPDGALILSAWQFPDSARQMRKVVDWSTVGLAKSDVEKSDYLMTWGGNETALRYVAYIDRREIAEHAAAADLQVKDQFRSDGREGDLNLYAILRR
jgi:2-polyprenyl-3-methyl-5-hydroxy-6-metoxy-1,4-benzoquinol methylase